MKPTSRGSKKPSRQARLKKIKEAQLELEEELLSLRAMYGNETDEYKRACASFGKLYYLIRLAKKAL